MEPTGDGLLDEWAHDITVFGRNPYPRAQRTARHELTPGLPSAGVCPGTSGIGAGQHAQAVARDAAPAAGACVRIVATSLDTVPDCASLSWKVQSAASSAASQHEAPARIACSNEAGRAHHDGTHDEAREHFGSAFPESSRKDVRSEEAPAQGSERSFVGPNDPCEPRLSTMSPPSTLDHSGNRDPHERKVGECMLLIRSKQLVPNDSIVLLSDSTIPGKYLVEVVPCTHVRKYATSMCQEGYRLAGRAAYRRSAHRHVRTRRGAAVGAGGGGDCRCSGHGCCAGSFFCFGGSESSSLPPSSQKVISTGLSIDDGN
jgi:hypothetical protein